MEAAFITNAIRRYWWIVVAFVVLGALPGLLQAPDTTDKYDSRAVLLLAPPSESRGQLTTAAEPDRYVKGQLSVLNSQALAERVAERLGGDWTASGVGSSVRFDHEQLTDIVHVVASTPNPELSQELGNAYLDVYFDSLRAQIDDAQRPEIEQLDEQIADLQDQIDQVDTDMNTAMRPFLTREQIPTIEQVAPQLASRKQLLINEYNEILATKNELNTNARLRVSSEIVQRATLPSEAAPTSPNVLLAVGLVGGLLAGVFAAVLTARFSSRVLGDDQAEEILGQPVLGTMPRIAGLDRRRATLLDRLQPDAAHFVDGLAVRAEALAEGRSRLTLTVTGTRRGAGATTVAGVLARSFADNGAQVLLVDADRADPELTSMFLAPDRLQDRSRWDQGSPTVAPTTGPTNGGPIQTYSPADAPNIRVINMVTLSGSPNVLHRQHVIDLLAEATARADVIVFDGGPLLEAASTVHLSRLCDAVVLAMPSHQSARALDVIAGELSEQSVLPVWVPSTAAGVQRRLPSMGRNGRRNARTENAA